MIETEDPESMRDSPFPLPAPAFGLDIRRRFRKMRELNRLTDR